MDLCQGSACCRPSLRLSRSGFSDRMCTLVKRDPEDQEREVRQEGSGYHWGRCPGTMVLSHLGLEVLAAAVPSLTLHCCQTATNSELS